MMSAPLPCWRVLRPPAVVLLVGSALLAGCVPADEGRSVSVANQCSQRTAFLLDGGPPRSDPEQGDPIVLESGTFETYSVLVGKDQPAYIWLRLPPGDPVVISPSITNVVLAGEPCTARPNGTP